MQHLSLLPAAVTTTGRGLLPGSAGKRVVVLEAADTPGGGSRTDETIPGYLFNTHAAAHNIINITRILAEPDLAGADLEYLPMDPFATGMLQDGHLRRLDRSGRRDRRQQRQGRRTRDARGATVAAALTTRRFALSRAEWATTAVAGVVSSAAYVKAGYPYPARGVVGDLAGFLVLGVAGSIAGARVSKRRLCV